MKISTNIEHRGWSLFLITFFTVFPGFVPAGQEIGRMELEQNVCGWKEPLVFWLWSTLAGSPDAVSLTGLPQLEDIVFETLDGRRLRGYKLKAAGGDSHDSSARGYLLVLQGNAMLADRIITEFEPFSTAGLDVYVYDFRGYGRSEGKRRLKAMISDYTEIIAALNAAGYERRFIYALSFGGILFLDGFGPPGRQDRVVIDSTPSRLSEYGCPPDLDPVEHLPDDCSNFLFIVGRNDAVVPPAMSLELVEQARQCNATVLTGQDFGHPFMDSPSAHRRRLGIVEDFLLHDRKP